jgi:hypothetical protein
MPDHTEWQPGLDNPERSLLSVYQTLPGDTASSVPWFVRLLENPSSPLCLGGAVDLFGHDCIHILLGRGLHQQDEAFVLGFTMGNAADCPEWQALLFRWCAEHLYRGAYQFAAVDGQVFRFALEAARRSPSAALNTVDYRAWLDRPLGELRAALGIDPAALRRLYALEAAHWPGTVASSRLPRGGT